MGNQASTVLPESENRLVEEEELLIREITKTSIDLADMYQQKFLEPDFCNRVSLIASNSLGHFSNYTLNNITYQLGIVADNPELKNSLCLSIAKHYVDRINLISVIVSSLEYCGDRIKALITGPRCKTNPDEFDPLKCEGGWIENINLPEREDADGNTMNDRYFDIINELHHSFIDNLNELKSILDDLLNLDINVTDEQLLELRRKTQEVIVVMKKDCQRLYINALLTDVTTPEEKQNLNELARQNEEIRQMQKDTIQESLDAAADQQNFEEEFIRQNIGSDPDTNTGVEMPDV